MSTAVGTPTSLPSLRVTYWRVAHSEWTKFTSVRSTLYTLTVAVLLMIGLGAIFSAIVASEAAGFGPGSSAISTSLIGTFFAQLAVGVLAVLMISGEYGTGMIRASMAVVPQRHPVLAAKLAVLAVAVFSTMLLSAAAAFLIGQVLMGSLGVGLSEPAALRSIFGAALYLTVAALTGMALGALLRNTAASITIFVGVFFLLPPLTSLLPPSWTDHFVQYLPSNAGAMLLDDSYGVAYPLAPWPGFALMCCYALILVALAGWRLRRLDA